MISTHNTDEKGNKRKHNIVNQKKVISTHELIPKLQKQKEKEKKNARTNK